MTLVQCTCFYSEANQNITGSVYIWPNTRLDGRPINPLPGPAPSLPWVTGAGLINTSCTSKLTGAQLEEVSFLNVLLFTPQLSGVDTCHDTTCWGWAQEGWPQFACCFIILSYFPIWCWWHTVVIIWACQLWIQLSSLMILSLVF